MNPLAKTIAPLHLQIEVDTQEQLRLKVLPPWRVLLHNDNDHLFEEVIVALVRSVPLSTKVAEHITMQAHATGLATVIMCPREIAECYQERLLTYNLTVTIEPA